MNDRHRRAASKDLLGSSRPLMTGRDREVLRELCDVLLPEGGPLGPGGRAAGADRRLADLLDGLTPVATKRTRTLIRAFDWVAALGLPLRRFARQTPEAQRRTLERMRRSRWLDFLLEPLQAMLFSSYVTSPEIDREIDFDERCVADEPPRQGPRLQPIRYPEISGDLEVDTDVCVVGSGAGGASDVRRYQILALPIVAAKMTSAILGLVFFGLSGSGPYLVIFCTDFPMGVITLWLYWRVTANAPAVGLSHPVT